MLRNTDGKSDDFNGFDVRCLDDRLSLSELRDIAFESCWDGWNFLDDFIAETEEDVRVGLFQDITIDILRILGNHH